MRGLPFLGMALVILAGTSCGEGSGAGTGPAGASAPMGTPGPVSAMATPCPTTSPSPLPYAIFSVHSSQCASSPSANTINAQFSAQPVSGLAPLLVHFNMCKSSDPDPAITLNFHVVHGDGSPDDGGDSTCKYSYTYPNPGTYTATECVWDEIPADAPGVCKSFTITVNATCSVAFLNIIPVGGVGTFPFCPPEGFVVQTSGNGSCGSPLIFTVSTDEQPTPVTITGTCPPGPQCTIDSSNNLFGDTFTLTGVNAQGSAVITPKPLGLCGG